MKTHTTPTTSEIVARIVRDHHPQRIILFGSRARGDAREESDYDLLVIKPFPLQERRTIRKAIYHSLYGMGIAKDIILATPEETTEFGHLVGSVLQPAIQEGVILYDHAA